MVRRTVGAALAVLIACVATPRAAADEPPRPTEPDVHITLPWLATQLVPSPEVAVGQGGARFGLRWQVTPLLFSWGIHRGLSPWRFFVAEPYVRQSGSVELYVTPEWIAYGASVGDGAVLRVGVRSYFPLLEHGETLSASLGTSALSFAGRARAAYELGLYTLYGVVGVQAEVSPESSPLSFVATLRLRYF